ncbi:MAG TPA: Trk system potassium transporter TrkA [Halococcus sp.]|nr:Trk system potassium transporter TrkA [Halococcus sp.]
MRVVVVGAGDVGTHIAADLTDTHDLAVVDVDPNRVQQLESSFGVTAVEGDGRSLGTLEDAGIHEADVVIASTDNDAVNVMVCGAVNNVTDATTIARAKSADLVATWQAFDDAFGIDLLLSVDRLTAEKIIRTVTLPGALTHESYVDGQVDMAEFEIDAESSLAGQTIGESGNYPSLTFAGLMRDGEVRIPGDETVFEPEDRVVVIGSPSSVRRFAGRLSPEGALEPAHDVVVIGGGEVGRRTAQILEAQDYAPRLIEHDPDRAAELTEQLDGTTVIEGDATSYEFLVSEDIGEAELVISTLDDETNYLVSLLASEMGSAYTAAVVDVAEYTDLFEAAGVDVTVQPHTVVAREISRATREYTDEATILEHDSAEVLEITVERESVLAGESIDDVKHDLPDEFVIGAIVRSGSLTTPRGGTVIQVGDHVVAFVDTDVLDDAAAVL